MNPTLREFLERAGGKFVVMVAVFTVAYLITEARG